MPTHEAVVNTIIPKTVEQPIPTRTVSTKAKVVTFLANTGQDTINKSPAAESAPPEESVRLSPQLSALARKEQAFRQREQALKDREKALEAKLAGGDKYEALKAKMSAKDYSEAESLGLSYEEYTKYVLDKQGGTDPNAEKLKALEAEIQALKKGTEESAASQYEETVAEYKKEITKLVAENPEFSSIKGIKGGEESVMQLILDSFEEDDDELTVHEAATLVEQQLVERGKIYASLPKLKTEGNTEKVLPRPVVGKTLRNDMTVSSETAPRKSLQGLSEAERYAEARRRVLERREKGK